MARRDDGKVSATIGKAIRTNRLRAGMTQSQLAAVISRTGKFLSEVETGRTRISEAELAKLATALGVSPDRLLKADPVELDREVEELPRRIRDSQPTGLVLFTLQQLIDYLDRAGWLRSRRLWSLSHEPFPEERNIALVEQLAELVHTRGLRLRYVYPRHRLKDASDNLSGVLQGTSQALPEPLLNALRWSTRLREHMDADPSSVVGYALDDSFPFFSPLQSHLWVETADTSWSEVMPLLYGRSETRTHENASASAPFWYHLPRDMGSRMLIGLAHCIKMVDRRPLNA